MFCDTIVTLGRIPRDFHAAYKILFKIISHRFEK